MCRARREPAALQRVARANDRWVLGPGPGRGASWCATGDCGSALTASLLSRALRVTLGDDDVVNLREGLQALRTGSDVRD